MLVGLAMQKMVFFRKCCHSIAVAAAFPLTQSLHRGKISSQVCFYNEEEVLMFSPSAASPFPRAANTLSGPFITVSL